MPTMIKDILERGWKDMHIGCYPCTKRTTFEKGNYWLTLDTRHYYSDFDFIEVSVRDPALEMSKVGDNRGTPWFSFRYNGLETLEALESLLIW